MMMVCKEWVTVVLAIFFFTAFYFSSCFVCFCSNFFFMVQS